MSQKIYRKMRSEMRSEICVCLSKGGFGDYNAMLDALRGDDPEERIEEKEERIEAIEAIEEKKERIEAIEEKKERIEAIEEKKERIEPIEINTILNSMKIFTIPIEEKEDRIEPIPPIPPIKEKKKKVDITKGFILPWCGVVMKGKCNALKLNSGLHTQCMKDSNEQYCTACLNIFVKNGGSCPYGTVEDRLKYDILEYKDPKGKQTIPYANVMKKLNINKEEAVKEANKMGWIIPECHFNLKSATRGRRKKEKECVKENCEEKKKRGRPKKEKEIVTINVGEELIASLIEDSQKIEKDEQIVEEKDEELRPSEIDEDDDATDVKQFEIDGVFYYISVDNVLYDMNSHDCVGIWNEDSLRIDEIPDDDD